MNLLIKGGTVVTACDVFRADVLIRDGRISQIGSGLDPGSGEVLDASSCYVLPGGVDMHTHLDMPFGGTVTADDFFTGTRAAACGGTTTIIDWAIQAKGGSLREAVETWKAKAEGKAVIDYALHAAVTDLRPDVTAEIPDLVSQGVSSLKCFMAYKGSLMIDDGDLFGVLKAAREAGAIVCVHCENGYVIDRLTGEFLSEGKTGPLYHALSRPPELEAEATSRLMTLAELADAPVFVVHLSCAGALAAVRAARARGIKAYAETCPQYLILDEGRYREEGFEGAKFVCSPPLRESWHAGELWNGLATGDLQAVGSDHCSFNFKGQKEMGLGDFSKIPNGLPGVETRLPLMYTYGVEAGRIGLNRFVEVISTAPARIFGLYPQKGTVAVGSDADLVIFDPRGEFTVSAASHHMNVDYNPFEGCRLRGRVAAVVSRGEVIVKEGQFNGAAGRGRFVERRPWKE